MDRHTKKKLRIVLITLGILIIPLGYLIGISLSIFLHDEAVKEAMIRFPNDRTIIIESINKIDKAIKIYPRNYLFHMNKAQLQVKIEDYRGALNSAKRGTKLKKQYTQGLEYIGLIYEYLNLPDSASIFYSKSLNRYLENLESQKKDIFISRHIALLYTFLGQKSSAQEYFTDLPDSLDPYQNLMIKNIDYYIENYIDGGLKDYLHGETIKMINDSISDIYIIDSLLNKKRIYYNGYNAFNTENQKVFEFRKIFKDKAELIGFKMISEK